MKEETAFELTADELDETSSLPLYQQIYTKIREAIISGKVPAQSKLPAEQELVQSLGVSRITVKRAFNELAIAGLVRRYRGRGTVVTYDATAPTVKGSFENLIDGLKRMGIETQVQLLDCEMISPSPAIAEALELSRNASVQRIVRLRILADEPFSYLVTYVPEDIAEAYSEDDLATASLISLLEKAGHRPCEATQTITAVPAEAAVAAVLGVTTGSPLLRIHRIMRDATGRPVQDITATYRADRFQYEMRLTREKNSDWTAE
ncbi:GntR family transcriptional regulator [Hyphomonas beringensis]|nr:GntR family transcriptional regulator [Hyphomonas beringensis]